MSFATVLVAPGAVCPFGMVELRPVLRVTGPIRCLRTKRIRFYERFIASFAGFRCNLERFLRSTPVVFQAR